jgi:hypothetical protein
MDDYFITKKAVEIIQANINDHFLKCLITLSINDRYTNDIKVILGIIELLKTYMETRRNDILSSCIKYTNKSYYLHLTDSLFRLIQGHLTFAKYNNSQTIKYVFIADLIEKHNNPVFANAPHITRNFNNHNARNRFNTCVAAGAGEDGEDGTGAAAAAAAGAGDYKADDDEYKDGALLASHGLSGSQDAGTLFRDAYYRLNKLKTNNKNAREFELKIVGNGNDLL